jgi:hypothetical protein
MLELKRIKKGPKDKDQDFKQSVELNNP